jgi:hypothetical protein
VGQPVEVFDGPQYIEMVDSLGELALLHHGTDEDGGNLVVAGVVVFIPGDDQQAVVALRKLDIAAEMLLQPGITLRNGAVMHVVVEIRDHEGDGR